MSVIVVWQGHQSPAPMSVLHFNLFNSSLLVIHTSSIENFSYWQRQIGNPSFFRNFRFVLANKISFECLIVEQMNKIDKNIDNSVARCGHDHNGHLDSCRQSDHRDKSNDRHLQHDCCLLTPTPKWLLAYLNVCCGLPHHRAKEQRSVGCVFSPARVSVWFAHIHHDLCHCARIR